MALHVVFLPDTGHVAGAVATTGGAVPADAAALVGDALPLRVPTAGGPVTVAVPARELSPLLADDEPRVFTDPLAFGVEQVADADPKPGLVRLADWTEGVRLDPTGLVVTVPVAAGPATPVFALVAGAQDTHVLAGEIAAGQDSVTLPLTVPAGEYGALVLVTGWVGRLVAVTAP
ncbi:hypothetical protein BLA60_17215 [Actinophytocola xinjiangensis]|uniref:Uncharacterized protein n=1 Tax=Actinophytocola xinjiangensis TaxID=485602 RepID=A0A7Z0WLF6_9PSEU|nr:hypothetical protein [Actinophytocola xinjiangensis]OLF10183.1 hypothetical protein BLA60_17215 [Actinophytocola xinjiangensis]